MSIQAFVPSKAEKYRIFLIIGGRNTGKTHLLEDLLFQMRKQIDICVAFCPTVPTVKMLKKHIPSALVYSEYKDDVLTQLIGKCNDLIERKKRRHTMILVDDCVFDSKIMKTQNQRLLHLNGRHILSSQIITTQYSMAIPPINRSNIDYVIALKEPIKQNRVNLFKHYFGCFDNLKQFESVFSMYTNNYGCLVIDKTIPSNNVCDIVKYYQAPANIPPFKLCKQVYWHFQNILDRKKKIPVSSS